jgi:hypothetical protein
MQRGSIPWQHENTGHISQHYRTSREPKVPQELHLSMPTPAFEATPACHEFSAGHEIYVTDANEVDLVKATVKRKLKKGHLAHHDDSDEGDAAFPNAERLLIHTPANTAIWTAQAKLRSALAPPDINPRPPTPCASRTRMRGTRGSRSGFTLTRGRMTRWTSRCSAPSSQCSGPRQP